MIPHGAIYTELRKKVFTAFPEGIRNAAFKNTTLKDWLINGYYTVVSTKNRNIEIETDASEFGAVLLTDIENLCNNSFEHLQELFCHTEDTRMRSDAWNVVTIYYYGYFSAQALMRIIGCPVIYMGKENLNQINHLSPSFQKASPGVYILESSQETSATKSKYIFKMNSKRPHEATWYSLLNLLKATYDNCENPTIDEAMFYSSLTTNIVFEHYIDFRYPSTVRNNANYGVGYAYRMLDKCVVADTKKLIRRWEGKNINLNDILYETITSCSTKKGKAFSCHVRLVHDISHSIFLLYRKLYAELLLRRNIDKRWELKRRKFILLTKRELNNCPMLTTYN